MFDRITRHCTLEGHIVAQSALHVGTEQVTAPVGTDHPVLRNASGEPFIPGASIKGALRSHLEAYARSVSGDAELRAACDPVGSDKGRCISDDELRNLKRKALADDVDLSEILWDRTCLLCRTFGAPWWASSVRFSDAEVIPALWAGQFEVRDGVAIDRDKGAAAHQRLYSYEVVPAGTAFSLQFTARNLTDWQLGLLWLGIRAMTAGQIALGGLGTRGLGWVVLEDFAFTVVEPEGILSWLAGGTGGLKLTTPDAPQAKLWIKALQLELRSVAQDNIASTNEETAYA